MFVGYFCTSGSASRTPANDTNYDICPPGYYCEVGASLPDPCPPGTYSADTGQFSVLLCCNVLLPDCSFKIFMRMPQIKVP